MSRKPARRIACVSLALALAAAAAGAQVSPAPRREARHARARVPSAADSALTDSLEALLSADQRQVRGVIRRHLGRPYVWGASGLKSFDCSGFVWRVMQDNGILMKRTTARKFYMSLPKVADEQAWGFGNIVFFSDLKHCGIVETREGFYHAAVSTGTHLSRFDPFWRRRVVGVRAMPGPR